ncbi:MFS transporter [Luteibaculum oceani]|uniref:MFS transporter n=1 Tax=Luteibaculum oceani TaxID=1294296 RepID=A0A5C6VDG6_9FLAO|nr:MFS transporter [Luteibaculum oceani]TXC81705.1 MFS transporter [Luteibaculum oceani]
MGVVADKKVTRAWAMYDWANSVYPLVVTTAIFPIFYEKISTGPDGSDIVNFFGFDVVNTALVSYVSATMFVLVSILSPLLSGVADYTQRKKFFLKFFFVLGSISCASLAFFKMEYLELSMLIYLLAGLGFWASLVFYNGFLPLIAPREQQDAISAQGYSLGYIGSSILLIICLALVMGVGMDARLSFVITAIWWMGFGFWSVKKLPEFPVKIDPKVPVFSKGFYELRQVWKGLKNTPRLKRYLSSFFVFSMGVQTVMIMAVYFGTKEITWASEDEKTVGLIVSVLIIQIIAAPGSKGLAWLSTKIGNVKALAVVLLIWCVLCISALWVTTPVHFYVIAGFVGLVMGGVQSLSRSTYSKLLPDTEDTTSYFSFYDISEKIGLVIGILSYGLIEQLTGSMRNSIFALIVFFIVGLLILLSMPKEERAYLKK